VRPDGRDVLFVTMAFPWPSEAFAGVEVRALIRAGATVRVRALRNPHPEATHFLQDWKLDTLDLTHATLRGIGRGILTMLAHPWIATSTLAWLASRAWRRPRLFAKCLLFVPRMFELFGECRERPPAVVHLFWGHYPAVLGYLIQRWLPGVHVSVSLMAYDLIYRFPATVEVASRADSLWTLTECNVPAIREMGIRTDRLRVVLQGIDLEQVPRDCAKKVPGMIVSVARLEENKGTGDLLLAFAEVSKLHREARLVIIGQGDDRPRFEAQAEALGITGLVTFTGPLPHSQVYDYLRQTSIFALLSKSPAERLPNAVKEAMACRCLCVVTQTPGIEELLAPYAHKFVVEQGDWRAAVRFLRHLLDRPHDLETDRDAGRTFAFARLDARRVAEVRLRAWRSATPRLDGTTGDSLAMSGARE
jgi:colanic acid/amylovoran biosynthesis glycosyltransferase